MQAEVPQTLILNRSILQSLLTMSDVNQAIEDAFLAYGNGHWEVPAKIIFSQAQYDGDFGAMPAYCHDPEFIAIKWGGVHNRNPQIGLPTTLTQIIVDHKSQARIYGEIHRPLQQQQLPDTAVAGDIGEVVAGRVPGRQSDSDITVFDGTGMALEDAAVVYRAYHLAREQGLGQVIGLQ